MATELGQAYVQIMPSAKGISGKIQSAIDPEATAAGKSAGGKLGLALKAGVAAAAAGLGAIIAGSISQGADLEQSIGGIETLFKDSADTVRGYANEAYKTVGVSANDYMENVTSFSASLLQSMGGDTKEAAKVAHTAMVDMGDNANKMGTDMGSIQDAYQGFAKENYTMLDNLKLGYGGTKTEMERLLKDAQELTGVEYDISNLDDVFMAIHAIQEEIGITGTTALEAEETISGSFNALKAAFTDVLGNLAIGENLNTSLNALADTFATFLFGNLIPMIGQIVSTLPGAIITLIQAAIPILREQGLNLIQSMGGTVYEGMPILHGVINTLLFNIITWIKEQFPTLLQQGIDMILNFANGFLEGLPLAIMQFGMILRQLLLLIFESVPLIMNGGYQLIVGMAQGIWSNLPAVVYAITDVLDSLLDMIIQNYPALFKQGWSLIGQLATGLWNNLPQIISTIGRIIGQLLGTIGSRYPELIRMGFDLIIWLGEGLLNAVPNIVRNIPQIVGAIVSTFSNLSSQFVSIGADIVRGLWQGINSVKDWILGKIGGFVDSITGGIKSFFGIKSPSTVMADEIGKWLPPGLAEGIEGNMSPVTKAMEDLANLTTGSFESEIAMNAVATGTVISKIQGDNGNKGGIEITNNNYSPEPLTDREIARQTKLSLQKLAYNL
jgi:phage-related protein